MRIAQVCGPYRPDRGGIARVVQSFKSSLEAKGHDVRVLSAVDEFSGNLEGATVVTDRHRVRVNLIGAVREIDPDVVHVHCYASWLPANVSLLRTAGYPIVFTPHYHPRGGHPRWKRELFDLVVGNTVFRAVDQIHALTEGEAETIAKRFGVKRYRITVIHNPLPPALVGAGISNSGPAAPRDGRMILYVGRLDNQKGLEHLVRAFAMLGHGSVSPGLRLKIVGDDSDPYSDEVRSLIAELGLTNADVAGPVSDEELIRLYRKAAMLVLPSAYEAFGMVLLEAMAFGCPVVASAVGGIPWIVTNGRNGLLHDYADVDGLAQTMRRLLSDGDLRESLISGGHETVRRYSAERVAARLEALYSRTMTQASS